MRPSVFTISADRPFLVTLAHGLVTMAPIRAIPTTRKPIAVKSFRSRWFQSLWPISGSGLRVADQAKGVGSAGG